MISRRKARIKALQTLFMDEVYDSSQAIQNPEKLKTFYKESIQQTIDGVYTILWFIKKVNENAAEVHEIQGAKLSEGQSADERILKLAHLDFVQDLAKNENFRKKIESLHIPTEVDPALIRNLYKQYINLPEIQAFLDKSNPTEEDEKKTLQILLQDVLIANDTFQDFMENKYSLWYDDETEVVHMVSRIIDMGLDDAHLQQLASKDVYDLGLQLIDAVISKREYFDTLIMPKLKNWDPKRIAPLDIIVLYLGIAEFLYMPSIPVVVTINEYIDIIKQYGASQSKQFVNAILDRVKTQLLEENHISKEN